MPRLLSVILLAFVIACSSSPKADLVVFGRIWTADSANPWAAGIATRGDSILAVGDSAAVAPYVGSTTRRLSPGAFVTPGFMDDHVHLFTGGFQLTSVDLRERSPWYIPRTCGIVAWLSSTTSSASCGRSSISVGGASPGERPVRWRE